MPCVWAYGPPSVRELSEAFHNVPGEEDGALVLLVQHALFVEPLEYADLRGVEQRGVRVPEDGDELVCVNLRFDRAQRRVAALAVCEGGAQLHETDFTVDLGEREFSRSHGRER